MSAPRIGRAWEYELQSLNPNWDGENAPTISLKSINTVRNFNTVPTSTGGIQLEIHQDGYDVEIDISAEGKIVSVLVCHDKL